MAKKDKWIQDAVKPENKGLLHKKLHVKKGEKIPESKLKAAAKKGGKIAKEANFAMNVRKLGRKK